MSWKSLVTAGLLCVIASPAFAVATLQAVKGGTEANGFLNADGNWVWRVNITPTGGSSVATEIGFRETTNAELLTAAANAANFNASNPGSKIFAWQPNAPMYSEGVVTNLDNDEVFTALGSTNIIAGATSTPYLDIVVQGPSTTNNRLSTTLQWLGIYNAAGEPVSVNGLIAETIGTTKTFSNVAGSATFTAKAGDANLDGSVGFADFNAWLTSAGNRWQDGDFNDDGSVGFADFNIWLTSPGGAGAGGIAAPEPTSIFMLVLGSLIAIVRRTRR